METQIDGATWAPIKLPMGCLGNNEYKLNIVTFKKTLYSYRTFNIRLKSPSGSSYALFPVILKNIEQNFDLRNVQQTESHDSVPIKLSTGCQGNANT